MHLFDKTITANAFRASFKNKFTIIWGSMMFSLTLLCFFLFALISQGKVEMLGINIMVTSLLVLITVLIWNIISLNSLFSVNQELGIMNLEIRKGRTNKEIFLSRLLVNKSITLIYIFVMMALYAIIFAIFNQRELKTFWMFFTYLPTDLFFTAIFLFFYSMGRYKLTIALSSVLLTLILLTPILQLIGSLISDYSADRVQIARIYSADQILTLAHKSDSNDVSPYDESESFTYRLLNDASLLNQPLDAPNASDNAKFTLNDAGEKMLVNGLLSDEPTILKNLYEKMPILSSEVQESDLENLAIKSDTQKTLLYQINSEFKGDIKEYKNDYAQSLYADHLVTNAHYQSIIKSLKTLNQKINQKFSSQYSNVKGFTDLVLNYAQGMLYNSNYNSYSLGVSLPMGGYRLINYKEYLERIADFHSSGDTFTDLEFLDQNTLFENLSISPALRLWNEIAYQLIKNALTVTKEEMNQVSQKLISLTSLSPWNAQFEAWMFAQPKLNFYEYCRLNTSNWMESTIYWIWNNSHYYNDSQGTQGTLKSLNIRPTNFDSPASFKAFSIVGYEVAIAGIGLVFIGLAFLIFFKRLKK